MPPKKNKPEKKDDKDAKDKGNKKDDKKDDRKDDKKDKGKAKKLKRCGAPIPTGTVMAQRVLPPTVCCPPSGCPVRFCLPGPGCGRC